MRRLAVFCSLLLAAAGLAACGDTAPPPETTALVPEADVERLRIRLFEATIPLDAALADVEADAAAATDTLVQQAYAPLLDRLRDDRRRLQARMDSLRPLPRARFDSASAEADRAVARLRASIARAALDATPSARALQAAVAAELARADGRLRNARTRAQADTTGRQTALLDSLDADRERLVARLRAYPDTSVDAFPPFRERIIQDALRLRARADRLAPDSSATVRFRRAPATPPQAGTSTPR